MIASWTRPLDARWGVPIAALAALLLLAAFSPGLAGAAEATGKVTLKAQPGKATSDLFEQGVKLTSTSKGKAVSLSVTELNGATVKTKGNLVLAKGNRKAILRQVILKVGAKGTTISARLGKGSSVFFRASGSAKTDANSIKLNGATLSLTAGGAKKLRGELGLSALKAGKIGKLNVKANAKAAPPTPTPPAPTPPSPPQPKPEPKPQPDPYPFAAACPINPNPANPGFGDAPGTIGEIADAPTFSAASQPVTGTTIEWGFLSNFRGYVISPPSGSVQGLDGATTSAPGAGMAAPNAFVGFPVSSGTYERGTQNDYSDDKLVANGGGVALFCKSGHGFSIALKDPTVTIDGANSRLTYDVGSNFDGIWHAFQRVDFAELDLSGVTPTVADGGNSMVWAEVPAKLTADGAESLGLSGQYPAGTVLDKVTVKTTLDRPLLAQCGVDAGSVPVPPTVDFTLTALPTLTSPVVRTAAPGKSIGTINWGFRRATRATVAAPGGLFLALDGATEAFPGSMGGSASLPPAGGLGKFFRFPIVSYSYEAGTGDPGDDRLIATSNATVGLCKPKTSSGNYAVVLSKPTLIIDGENSRIIANAYSFAGPFMGGPAAGWSGGRVELVDLDTSAIDAVTKPGTVKWGEVTPDWEPLENGIPVSGGLLTNALSIASGLGEGAGEGGFDPVAAQIVLPAS